MDEHGDTVGWRVRVEGGDAVSAHVHPPLLALTNACPGRVAGLLRLREYELCVLSVCLYRG